MSPVLFGALATGLSTTAFLLGFGSVRLRAQRDRVLSRSDTLSSSLMGIGADPTVVTDAQVERTAEAFTDAQTIDPVGKWTVGLAWVLSGLMLSLALIAGAKSSFPLSLKPLDWAFETFGVLFFLIAQLAVVATGTFDYRWVKRDLANRLSNSTMELVTKALRAQKDHNVESALTLASQLHDRLPSWPWVLLFRAHILSILRRLDEASVDLNRAVALDPTNPWARVARAEYRLEHSDFAGALTDLEALGQALPQDATVLRLLGSALYAAGRREEAVDVFGRIIQLEPGSADVRISRGKALAAADHTHSLGSASSELIEMFLDEGDRIAVTTIASRGIESLSRQDLDAAIEDFTVALTQDPANLDALVYRGEAYIQRGDIESGDADFDAALATRTDDAFVYRRRGRAFYRIGELARAEEAYTRSISLKPSARAHFLRGMARQSQERWAEALADFEAAVELDPSDWDALSHKAGALAALRRLDEALEAFRFVENKAPSDVHNYQVWSASMGMMGRYADGLPVVEKGLALDPSDVELLLTSASLHTDLRRYGQALSLLQRAEDASAPSWAVAFRRGRLLWMTEDLEGAETELSIAASQASQVQRVAVANRATVRRGLGRYDDALEDYDKAISMAPPEAGLLVARGCLLHVLKRSDEALVDFNQALQVDSTNISALKHRIDTYISKSQFEAAKQDLATLSSIAPDDTSLLRKAAKIAFEERRWTEAADLYRRILEADPDNQSTLWSLAAAYANGGDYTDAEAIFSQLVRVHPNDLNAQLGLQVSISQQGRSDDAVAGFGTVVASFGEDAVSEWMQTRLFPDMLPEYDRVMADWRSSTGDSKP